MVPRREEPEMIRYPVPPGGIRPSFAAMNAAAENREAVAAAAASAAASAAAATLSPALSSQIPIAKSLKRPAEHPVDCKRDNCQYRDF